MNEFVNEIGYETCPLCEEDTLHVYTAEQGEFLYCECCGLELVLNETKH